MKMKFQVARRDLDAALSVVNPAVSSSGGDISSHFVFRPHAEDAGKIEMLSYTGRVCAAAPFVATIEGDDRQSFTIEGGRLKQWLSAVPEDAVLTFEFTKASAETTVTLRNDSAKKQFFPSLDPAHFPYWDRILSEAKVTARLPGDRLKDALAKSKLFTAEDESKNQGLCVSEVRDGTLISTNKSTLCMIVMPDMKDAKIRVHNKDVGSILTFLNLAKSEPVEILEHDRTFFFRRLDGSYFGETRFYESFPQLAGPTTEDQHVWEIAVPELKRGLAFVQAGAAKDDDRLWLSERDGKLVLKMETPSGKHSVYDFALNSVEHRPDAPDLPDSIQITVKNLRRVLDAAEGSVVKIGANVHKKSGYFRYRMTKFADSNDAGGDQYLIMVVWNKNTAA